ncbi:MAG: DUF1549 and DUF1553 domain-containing protein, partial [Limisphaerales bacterium]
QARNPIDNFIVAKLAGTGLRQSPEADRYALIRRVSLDLTGLPPTLEETDAFVNDISPDAYEKVVDRLLASPHYGERWARHWLDVARFAESSGFEHDFDREGAFYYRDFVIKALNSDMPYDQFIRWQLAGDEFEPTNTLALTATGFLGAGVFPTQITANEVERTRYDALDDMLATTSVAFIGMTVGCARCHDHKYDPIPTKDYYRMLSTFTTTVRSVIDLDMDPKKSKAAHLEWEKKHDALNVELKTFEAGMRPGFETFLAAPKVNFTNSWSLLDDASIKSKGGATFNTLEDSSYLAQGANEDDDEYTIVGSTMLKRVTAIRLDALSHSSLPHGGPGRAENGNFALSNVRVFVVDTAARPSLPERTVKISKAAADFEQNNMNLSIASSIDDDPKTGWAVDPQFGKDHSAMFTLEKPVELTNSMTLKVVLDFHVNKKHNIGRPRLSVTGDDKPSLKSPVMPGTVANILTHASATGMEDRALVFNWWKQTDAGWREVSAKVEAHAAQEPDGKTKVLICGEGYKPLRMYTQGADFFEQTYILKRGNVDMKDGAAAQGFLQVLNRDQSIGRWKVNAPEKAKFSGRRATLANWITATNGGAGILAARVMVNRLWQHHFGRGIVETPNDFGHAGALPTHPELLDYLAGELLRNGWKLKPIHKLIMTSATYMQSTAPDPKKEAADPENKYFCRRMPHRLEGEAIRDCMLAVSGALDATMFGPGTKDEKSRRRSIYFTIKRSQLMGSMVAFDCPEPLVSQGFRPTTTVAPQALMILNGPQVREWAEALARKVGGESDSGKLVTRVYETTLGRKPTRVEKKDAEMFLKKQISSYERDEKTSKNAHSLAATDFCQVLFGLNEFVYEN